MKRTYIIASIVVGIVVLILLYRALFVAPAVQGGTVTRGELVTLVYATGRVSADSLATLRSKSGGIVTEVNVREGMMVKAGKLLLRTDTNDQELNLRNARNELASEEVHLRDREREFRRQQSLFQSRTATQAALDNAQKEFDLARISVERKRINVGLSEQKLADAEIRTPYGGIIISSSVNTGDLLPPNAECFQLMAPSSVTIQADIAEQDISRLNLGLKCIVAFDAYPRERFRGNLFRLVPRTDEATKTSRAVIRLEQQPDNLTIGMTATVNVIAEELHNVLLLPRTAIQEVGSARRVFVISDNRLQVEAVELGATDGNVVQLIGTMTLREGTRVVLQPKPSLTDGMKVKVE